MKILLHYFILLSVSAFSMEANIASLLSAASTTSFNSYTQQGKIMSAHTKLNLPFTINFNRNPTGLHVNVKSKFNLSEVQLDEKFNVLTASFNVYDKEIIEKIKYNQRFAQRNQYDEVVFNFLLDNNEIRRKGVYYTNNTLDTFSIIPILQTICGIDVDVFSADLGVQHMALKAPIIIKKTITSDLSDYLINYTVPDELSRHLKNSTSSYIVYTLKVSGWQGFFYNYRHFYVYKNDPPFHYIGHWGGADKTNLFSWVFNP